MTIYDFTVKAQDGSEVSLADFKGKVILVVNTATGCGFTPQYEELQKLYEKYAEHGLVILDFPCNQFGEQAPGDNEEIHDFCTGRYGITFPQYAKIDVNGVTAIPLYKWITSTTKFAGFNGPMKLILTPMVKKMDSNYKNNGNIKWNFTKILVNREGEIVDRFEPTASMKDVSLSIQALL